MHPALRSFADDLHATLVRIFAYLCGLAAFAVAATELLAPPRTLAAVQPDRQPSWIDVGRPHAAFALVMSDLGDPEARYAIRRHPAGGGRKDIMRWGNPQGTSPFAMIEIYRPGDELDRFGETTTEIAARVRDLDVSEVPVPAETLDTKFGPTELADFVVTSSTGPRRCAGFVRSFGEPRLQIAGWYCNAGLEIVDRSLLACALDRLTLLAAGSDPKIAELFARAEIQRTFCGQKGQIMAATPRRDWIAAAAAPKLRGRQASR